MKPGLCLATAMTVSCTMSCASPSSNPGLAATVLNDPGIRVEEVAPAFLVVPIFEPLEQAAARGEPVVRFDRHGRRMGRKWRAGQALCQGGALCSLARLAPAHEPPLVRNPGFSPPSVARPAIARTTNWRFIVPPTRPDGEVEAFLEVARQATATLATVPVELSVRIILRFMALRGGRDPRYTST